MKKLLPDGDSPKIHIERTRFNRAAKNYLRETNQLQQRLGAIRSMLRRNQGEQA